MKKAIITTVVCTLVSAIILGLFLALFWYVRDTRAMAANANLKVESIISFLNQATKSAQSDAQPQK